MIGYQEPLDHSGGSGVSLPPIPFAPEPGRPLPDVLADVTNRLQAKFAIDRGVLLVKEDRGTRLIAIASIRRGREKRRLSLRLPEVSSLFARVADGGLIFTDEYYGLFSGNTFERNLLIDDATQSFVIVPLKHDGRVLGLLGFSSDQPTAFAALHDNRYAPLWAELAGQISRDTAPSAV